MAMDEAQRVKYLNDVNAFNERVRNHIEQVHQDKFQRVPLPNNLTTVPPLLSKVSSSGSGANNGTSGSSSLEMWEESVEQRLQDIDMKMKESDIGKCFVNGSVEEMDF